MAGRISFPPPLVGEGNFEETINEVNAVGRRGAQRGLEKEPRNGVAAVGANTLENEQTRTRRQGTHTFPRGERCTRTYVPAFTFPFNSNMHALVNFIILGVVVATSVWQSPLFSNRNGCIQKRVSWWWSSDVLNGGSHEGKIKVLIYAEPFRKIVWILK